MRCSCRRMDPQAIRNDITDTLRTAVSIILPYRCAICGDISDSEDRFGSYKLLYRDLYGMDPKLHICGKCLSSLNAQDEDRRWFLCLSNPVENDPCPGLALYMPFPYDGVVKKAVPGIKFGGQVELARLFGCLLGSYIRSESIIADIVVPIPLSEERLKERGFNQASEIAYPIAGINGFYMAEDMLVRTRNTERQSEIRDNGKRARNMSGAFAVNEDWDLTGMTIAVVDDVATTGATLHEAAAALYGAGACKVLCIAFAGNRQVKNAEPF